MIEAPAHITEALDRDFPGVRLEFNEALSVWVVTDWGYFPNGAPARDVAVRCGHYMKGVQHGPFSPRRACFALVDHETGQRWVPTLDTLLPVLQRTYNGARADAKTEFIDEIEASETTEQEHAVQENKDAAREAARWAFDHHAGKGYFGAAGAVTAKQVERDMNKRLQQAENEQAGPQAEEADREMLLRMQGR